MFLAVVDGFSLQCQSKPKCCTEFEVAEKVQSQAKRMRFQVRQQANATTVIFGETKALFESMVTRAEDEAISQISTIYQHRNFEPIVSAVRGFFHRLRGMFAHSRYNQIIAEHEFEKFLIELTGTTFSNDDPDVTIT